MNTNSIMKSASIFTALFLVVLFFYLQNHVETPNTSHHTPQEYMIDVTIVNYDTDGNPNKELEAKYWEFIKSLGQSNIRSPHVTIYKPNNEIWSLTANNAIAWHNSLQENISKIDLINNVVIERLANATNQPAVFKTSTLHYLPSEEKFTTDEMVTMEQPGLSISGHGLLGYLNESWIELHDKITTTYYPN